MRTLSAELTSAQQAVANTPHLEVKLTSRDVATVLSYKTDDATNRILRIRTAEGFFGGSLFEISAPNGDIVPIACQILLRNSDNEFTSKDLRGFKTEIKWGFESYWNGSSTVSISGTKISQGEPFWVFSQKDHSLEGEVITELQCISAWYYLALEKIMGTGFGDTYVASGSTIRGLLFDILTDNASKVFTFDSSGSSFADITSTVQDETSTSSVPVDTSDILYIGVADTDIAEFDRITIYGSVNGVYAGTSVWEYFNGASWAALMITDETSKLTDFDISIADFVPKVAHFDLPADMASTAINGSTLRWVRLRFTGAETTKPVINRIGVHRFWGLSNTLIDAIENDTDVQPDFEVSFDTSRLEILRIILDQTKSKFLMQENFFKMELFDESPSSTDYDYSIAGDHTVFADARERVALIPNEVVVTNIQNNGPADFTQITNNSIDTAEQARWGPIIEIENAVEVKTATLAALRALTRIERYQAQRYQGEFSAPINIGLEPWDWVGVTDSRLSITTTGRVGRVLREYNQASSIYRDVVTLGTPKWTASLSLNKFLNEARLGSNIGSSPDLPEILTSDTVDTQATRRVDVLEGHIEPVLAPFRPLTQPILADRFQGFDQGFDIDAGPFDLGIPFARDGYAPRKYNINPEAYGFRAKELTVDVLALRDFQKQSLANVLFYQDSTRASIVFETKTTMAVYLRTATVAHGMTTPVPTDTWGRISQFNVDQGGVVLTGFTERTDGQAALIQGAAVGGQSAVTKTALGYVVLQASKKSGTSVSTIPTTDIGIVFRNFATSTNFILGDGSFIWIETGAGDNYVGLKAPAVITADVIYSLPPADGSSGDHLRTDGSGVLTWETPAGSSGWTDDGTDVRLTSVGDDVGIGIATPDSKLHVMETSAGVVSAANNAVITLEDNTRAWLSFLSPTEGGIAFGDVADNDIGQIFYTHADNTMHFVSGASESIVLNGINVGIGISTPDSALHLWRGNAGTVTAHSTAELTLEDNADTALQFLNNNLDQASIFFGDEDSNVAGSIQYDHATGQIVFVVEGTSVMLSNGSITKPGTDLDLDDFQIYDLRQETSDPTLASLNDTEIVLGDVGSGNTQGRIWIRSQGSIYTFHSDNQYT